MADIIDLRSSNANLRKKNEALFQELAKYGEVCGELNTIPATMIQHDANVACGEGAALSATLLQQNTNVACMKLTTPSTNMVQHTPNVPCASSSDFLFNTRQSQPQPNLRYTDCTRIGNDVGRNIMHYNKSLRNTVAPIIWSTSLHHEISSNTGPLQQAMINRLEPRQQLELTHYPFTHTMHKLNPQLHYDLSMSRDSNIGQYLRLYLPKNTSKQLPEQFIGTQQIAQAPPTYISPEEANRLASKYSNISHSGY